tara:strand:+ start:329 stop:1567 length:1239 start_codon:yes stop_codon:yes gene_type:complete
MSLIRTFTVTVAGGKFVIDGVSQDTVNLAEGYTYKFDQADNTNNNHPFRFSTNSNNSPSAPYTTGVTEVGVPGNAGAYTEIVVADPAPQLYYYCGNHSGMGGTANTEPADTWGLLQWNQNTWGSQDEVNLTLTGLSATSSLGSVTAFNETGWGADTWGFEGWGNPPSIIDLPGFSLTSTVNLPADNVAMFPGWGTQSWGDNSWGDVTGHTFTLSGLSATSSTGVLEPEDVIGITGISATASVNSFALVSTDATFTLAGLTATASEGLIVLDDHSVGLGQLVANTNVGTLDPDDIALGITGVSADTTLGNVSISSEPVLLLTAPTGLTSTLGTVDASPVSGVTLSGLSATTTRGNLTTTQVSNAILTGLSATTTLNDDKLILKYYGRLAPKTSSGYTRLNPKTSTGYTRKTPA